MGNLNCGIDCSECASYKVTMNQDLKAAESLVEWHRGQGLFLTIRTE